MKNLKSLFTALALLLALGAAPAIAGEHKAEDGKKAEKHEHKDGEKDHGKHEGHKDGDNHHKEGDGHDHDKEKSGKPEKGNGQ